MHRDKVRRELLEGLAVLCLGDEGDPGPRGGKAKGPLGPFSP
ncbi:MAG TPA: hypothetical protein VGI45_19170 [Terracidiphilus sp.]